MSAWDAVDGNPSLDYFSSRLERGEASSPLLVTYTSALALRLGDIGERPRRAEELT